MRREWVSFAAIKREVPMEAVLEHYRIRGLRGGQGRYRGRCPVHRGEGEDAFHVELERNLFHCFRCGAGGTVLDLVARLEKCTLRQAACQLRDWFPGGAGSSGVRCQRVTKGKTVGNRPLDFMLAGVDGTHPYLAARNIGAGTAARFGVGFYRGGGLMRGRVVIPIHDERGQLLAYAGRSMDGSWPRYRFPTGFAKSRVLFNFHRAAAAPGDTAVVVEGFFDCMRVTQAGFASVVALMGTELYQHPARLLRERFTSVVVLLDGDEAGRKARGQVAGGLRDKCAVRVIELPEGVQPDQLPDGQLRGLLADTTGRRRSSVARMMAANVA
jgi:DNA primase